MPNSPLQKTYQNTEALMQENETLRQRLEEAEEALRAIRGGEVDALVVEENNRSSVRHIVEEEILAQSILEQVADAVVICNEKGIILRASRVVGDDHDARALNKPFEEVFALYPAGSKERIRFKDLVSNDMVRGYEVTSHSEKGTAYFLLSVGLLSSDKKDLMGAVITLTDITQRKKAVAALQEADRRKDEFLATLAHELRNPLAPLNNALNIIKVTGNSAVSKEAQEIMSRQLKQMVRLVDDLLDISRISRNMIELRRENVLLSEVMESALETVKPLIDTKHHTLSVKLPKEDVYLDADAARLAQIFSNLLNNAAKYTPSNGCISVDATVADKQLTVRIHDNGIGLDKTMLPKIFEMFSQVDSSLERSHGGLGIGLSLVKNLLRLHGGSIEAFSEGLGKGSEFVLNLPVSGVSAAVASKPAKVEEKQGHLRILVVDDNAASAQTMGWMVELMGHEAKFVHESDAVMEAAKSFKPDAILLDIGLPGKNGYEVCRELRALPEFKHTTLIAQTGWGQEKDKRMAVEAGFNHHLVKPVDADLLLEILDKVGASRN